MHILQIKITDLQARHTYIYLSSTAKPKHPPPNHQCSHPHQPLTHTPVFFPNQLLPRLLTVTILYICRFSVPFFSVITCFPCFVTCITHVIFDFGVFLPDCLPYRHKPLHSKVNSLADAHQSFQGLLRDL